MDRRLFDVARGEGAWMKMKTKSSRRQSDQVKRDNSPSRSNPIASDLANLTSRALLLPQREPKTAFIVSPFNESENLVAKVL
jgi:hypothetical protein